MRSLIHRLQSRLAPVDGEPSDEHLLENFLAHRGAGRGFPQVAEDAFTAIVRRHGPMVRGVCRRVLRNDADADDAFQAVFIVLLRKAEAVRPRNQLGNWLYGVAVNVARRGRDKVARRRMHEVSVDPGVHTPGSPNHGAPHSVVAGELREVIDQELSRLPDAYRAAVVVCDLEGHTRAEAAGRLGWSEGTVASRLARGRALLADRLARRGLAVPAAGLLVALGGTTADGAMLSAINFPTLLSGPSPAVEALAKEAMRAMTTSKLKSVAVALLTVAGLAGAGAATVWACGGYGPRFAPPVSNAKPFPFSSVETRENQTNDPQMAWAKPEASGEMGTDKPSGTDAGVAKPARFVLTNPARDITVVSDRHETFVEFFRRQPIMIATLTREQRMNLLAGKAPVGFVFVDAASFNVDGPRAAAYAASVKLAQFSVSPYDLGAPLLQLFELHGEQEPVVFVRDAADKNLWHATGVTSRASAGFFTAKQRVGRDDFAPIELLHTETK